MPTKQHIEHHVNALISENGLQDRTFILAVSGGVDSMVLLHVFHQLKLSFEVAHCNFQLRGNDSELDEVLVRDTCRNLDVNYHHKRFEIDAADNTQLAARQLRYEWFQELTGREKLLVLAHHTDDQVETVLLNLIRGTGINGLTAMEVYSEQEGGAVFRPLLALRKEALKGYAEHHQVAFREDASNATDAYSRNRIRNKIIPELEQIKSSAVESITNNIEEFQMLRAFLEKQVAQITPESKWNLDFYAFPNLPHDDYLRLYFFRQFDFGRHQLEALKELEQLEVGKEVCSSTHEILVDREGVFIRPIQEQQLSDKQELDLSQPSFTWNGVEFQTPDLPGDQNYFVRTWKAGEKVRVPNVGTKKVKDVLTDLKIPKWVKGFYPVVVNEDDKIVHVSRIVL